MMLTYKYLLRPNNQQADRLVFLLEQHRIVYNHALQQRINIYKETGECIGYDTQCQHFRDIRRENPDTLGLVNASSLQRTLRRLDKTYTSFFRRLQSGEKVGFLVSNPAVASILWNIPMEMGVSCGRVNASTCFSMSKI